MNTHAQTLMHTRLQPIIMTALVLFWASAVHAQTTTSLVYVCQDNGRVTLQNTQAPSRNSAQQCERKAITTQTLAVTQRQASDPQPTAQTLIVGAQVPRLVQQQRDFGRSHIVTSELNAAEQRLIRLQIEYNNGAPERIGNERNVQQYLDRVAILKQKIELTRSSIDALKRELRHIHVAP